MHHRNSGWVEPAAHDQPQPLRPEIGWQVRQLRRGQVRIVGATSPSGVAFPLPRAARRNSLQNGREVRVRAKALGENGEAVAAHTGALAAGEAHHDVGILPQAPVRVHANITRTGERRFQTDRKAMLAAISAGRERSLQLADRLCSRTEACPSLAIVTSKPAPYKAPSNRDDLAGP